MKRNSWRYFGTLRRRSSEHFTFDFISRRFILKELKALKRQKAPGIDEFPPGLLNNCADIIAGLLAYIINLSIKTSSVPLVWKIAKITQFSSREIRLNQRIIDQYLCHLLHRRSWKRQLTIIS